ncbi:hypothetical protein [Odoribacter lunatus]|uniref:hypothetical protein n=1 Tax=Odoribacter lunatus TaxID=2941335 RepID=UPI00203B721E|nr:hypothetical protein [Odoribacter lunatus]
MRIKVLMILSILIYTATVLCAQGKLSEEKRKEFEAQKVAYFTQALELTPEEAIVFWPLYNEMGKKIKEQETKIWGMCRETSKAEKLTEDQEKQRVMAMLENEQKRLNIKKEYYQKLLNVIPARKVARLDRIEYKFHKQLLQKMCKDSDNCKQ